MLVLLISKWSGWLRMRGATAVWIAFSMGTIECGFQWRGLSPSCTCQLNTFASLNGRKRATFHHLYQLQTLNNTVPCLHPFQTYSKFDSLLRILQWKASEIKLKYYSSTYNDTETDIFSCGWWRSTWQLNFSTNITTFFWSGYCKPPCGGIPGKPICEEAEWTKGA